MNCHRLNARLDDLLDGHIDAATGTALRQHTAECDDCRRRLEDARRVQALLKSRDDDAAAGDDFFDRVVMQAAYAGARQQRNRYWIRGFGTALAAGLALFATTLLFLRSPELPGDTMQAGIPGVTMTLEEPRIVNLVFASATSMVDAKLTVLLPDGVAVAGFEGQQEISWLTSLQAGRNVLPLELIATSPQGGEVMATLEHENSDRSFTIRVEVI